MGSHHDVRCNPAQDLIRIDRRTSQQCRDRIGPLQEEAADRLGASLFPGGKQAVDEPPPKEMPEERKPLIDLAGPEGIEPPTRGLGGRCSLGDQDRHVILHLHAGGFSVVKTSNYVLP